MLRTQSQNKVPQANGRTHFYMECDVMLIVYVRMSRAQWWESLRLAEALCAKMGPCPILRVEFDNRTLTDETHSSLSVPHSVQTGGKVGRS